MTESGSPQNFCIEVQELTKKFGHTHALRKLNFRISKNEIVGFFGPKGAGKSTLLKILAGLDTPSAGQVKIFDQDYSSNSKKIYQNLSYLSETNPLWKNLSVYSSLELHGKLKRLTSAQLKTRLKEIIPLFGLQKILKEKISSLSKAQTQLLGLAQALLSDPELLILDEPTTGLDSHHAFEIWNLIKQLSRKKTVIVASASLQELEKSCSQILLMHEGKIIVSGKPQEITSEFEAQNIYHLKIRGDLLEIESKLRQEVGAQEILIEHSENRLHSLEFIAPHAEDLGEKIFQTVLRYGWSLTELSKKQKTLEDVFLKLCLPLES